MKRRTLSALLSLTMAAVMFSSFAATTAQDVIIESNAKAKMLKSYEMNMSVSTVATNEGQKMDAGISSTLAIIMRPTIKAKGTFDLGADGLGEMKADIYLQQTKKGFETYVSESGKNAFEREVADIDIEEFTKSLATITSMEDSLSYKMFKGATIETIKYNDKGAYLINAKVSVYEALANSGMINEMATIFATSGLSFSKEDKAKIEQTKNFPSMNVQVIVDKETGIAVKTKIDITDFANAAIRSDGVSYIYNRQPAGAVGASSPLINDLSIQYTIDKIDEIKDFKMPLTISEQAEANKKNLLAKKDKAKKDKETVIAAQEAEKAAKAAKAQAAATPEESAAPEANTLPSETPAPASTPIDPGA